MIHSFIYNRKCSNEYGVIIKDKTVYNSGARSVTKQKIPGRNGNLIIDNGNYDNVEIKYSVTILLSKPFESIEEQIKYLKNWLYMNTGKYIVLSDTYDTDTFRYAAFTDGLKIKNKTVSAVECDISFDCKPFKYLVFGQEKRIFAVPSQLNNPTVYDSLPYIKISGNGNADLIINGSAFSIRDINGYIEIDSEIESAFKGSILQNNKIYTYPFPKFAAGLNQISWNGNISSVEIIPRWCCL